MLKPYLSCRPQRRFPSFTAVLSFLVSSLTLCPGLQNASAATAAVTSTTLTLTSGGTPVTTLVRGNVITLTATVTAGATPVSPGQVDFCDALVTYCTDIHWFGTAQLSTGGVAQLKLFPGNGTHSYRAVFRGTNIYAQSSSKSSSLNVSGANPTVATIMVVDQTPQVSYTLSTTIGGNGSSAPTGTVSFSKTTSGNAKLGGATLAGNAAALSTLPSPPIPFAVSAVADFNDDGIPDIASVQGNAVIAALGDGNGGFKPATPLILDKASNTLPFPVVADFNGDGIPDLAVAYGDVAPPDNGYIAVLLGKGDGTFSSAGAVAVGGAFESFTSGDFNHDGIPDFAVANKTGKMISIFLGNGDGTFTASPAFPTPTGTEVICSLRPMSAGSPTLLDGCMGAVDLNGDGLTDLVVFGVTLPDAPQLILLGNGDGSFRTVSTSLSVSGAPDIAIADFNQDGKPDLVIAGTEFLGNGDGTFTSTAETSLFSIVGDFDGDGKVDLAGPTQVFLGNGDSTFRTVTLSNLPYGSEFSAPRPVARDLNGDGTSDLNGWWQAGPGLGPAVFFTVNQTATATATGITLPVATGPAQVVASYSGDNNYLPSTSYSTELFSEQGTPTISVTASPAPAPYGTPITLAVTVSGTGLTPTGTVTFYDGSGLLGSQSLTNGAAAFATASLAVGSHSITVSYGGDSNYTSATQMATVTVVKIGSAGATVTVSPSVSSITNQQTVNVSVTVTGGQGAATPTGFITLASGSYSAQMALSGGTVTFAIPAGALGAGADTLTATYSGDGTFAGASGTATITVSPVVMGATAPSAIPAGGTATATVTLTAGSSYSGTLNLSCTLTTSPANAQSAPTCALNPSTATIAAGGNATTTLTVKTTAATSAMLVRPKDRLWGRGTEAAAFAALLMIGLRARRRRWLSILALLVTAICVVAGGCGGSHSTPKPSTPGTTAGNYVITVKAADSKDTTIATSANVNVTVQ